MYQGNCGNCGAFTAPAAKYSAIAPRIVHHAAACGGFVYVVLEQSND